MKEAPSNGEDNKPNKRDHNFDWEQRLRGKFFVDEEIIWKDNQFELQCKTGVLSPWR